MAKISNLNYAYGDFHLQIPEWRFSDREITCVWGPSGSGKSTLLQIMAGLLNTKEDYFFELGGQTLSGRAAEAREIGFVFQDFRLFPHMTSLENLQIAQKSGALNIQTVSEALSIGRILNQKASTLSGGEAQRVALARALIRNPTLVLLDEPFSSLDEGLKSEARNLVLKIQRQFSVPFVIVTHDLRDVRAMAADLLVLKDGKVICSGTAQTCLDFPKGLEAARINSENQVIPAKWESGKIQVLGGQFELKSTNQRSGSGWVVIKKWKFQLTPMNQGLQGLIVSCFQNGPHWECLVDIHSQMVTLLLPKPFNVGDTIFVAPEFDSCCLIFD
ncbi:MAG: ATP-binding cassette domain-containing protein [Oligoflexia bacterium]|nr:ATP-binding cassette domain-containing protein [Oligoflexia bacterium]